MARVGTAGQKFELLPVADNGKGEVIVEINGKKETVDTSTGNGSMLKLQGAIIGVGEGTPEQTATGHDILGRTFPFSVWIHKDSNAIAELVEAAGVSVDKNGDWDDDQLVGERVMLRYVIEPYQGEDRVNVKKIMPVR